MPTLPDWRYWELNKRIRSRVLNKPRRERLRVRTALARLHIRYWEAVSFWNPLHRGVHNDLDGGYQWLDFVIQLSGHRIGVVQFDHITSRGPHEYEVRYLETKAQYLEAQGIPHVRLSRNLTSQEYEILLYRFYRSQLRKEA